MDLAIKIIFLVVFFAVMIGIGLITRKKANSVEGFVLGGRNAGPWLTAFGYGTSYFSAVVFIGYLDRYRQRSYRFTSRMDHPWQKNKSHDKALELQDNA